MSTNTRKTMLSRMAKAIARKMKLRSHPGIETFEKIKKDRCQVLREIKRDAYVAGITTDLATMTQHVKDVHEMAAVLRARLEAAKDQLSDSESEAVQNQYPMGLSVEDGILRQLIELDGDNENVRYTNGILFIKRTAPVKMKGYKWIDGEKVEHPAEEIDFGTFHLRINLRGIHRGKIEVNAMPNEPLTSNPNICLVEKHEHSEEQIDRIVVNSSLKIHPHLSCAYNSIGSKKYRILCLGEAGLTIISAAKRGMILPMMDCIHRLLCTYNHQSPYTLLQWFMKDMTDYVLSKDNVEYQREVADFLNSRFGKKPTTEVIDLSKVRQEEEIVCRTCGERASDGEFGCVIEEDDCVIEEDDGQHLRRNELIWYCEACCVNLEEDRDDFTLLHRHSIDESTDSNREFMDRIRQVFDRDEMNPIEHLWPAERSARALSYLDPLSSDQTNEMKERFMSAVVGGQDNSLNEGKVYEITSRKDETFRINGKTYDLSSVAGFVMNNPWIVCHLLNLNLVFDVIRFKKLVSDLESNTLLFTSMASRYGTFVLSSSRFATMMDFLSGKLVYSTAKNVWVPRFEGYPSQAEVDLYEICSIHAMMVERGFDAIDRSNAAFDEGMYSFRGYSHDSLYMTTEEMYERLVSSAFERHRMRLPAAYANPYWAMISLWKRNIKTLVERHSPDELLKNLTKNYNPGAENFVAASERIKKWEAALGTSPQVIELIGSVRSELPPNIPEGPIAEEL